MVLVVVCGTHGVSCHGIVCGTHGVSVGGIENSSSIQSYHYMLVVLGWEDQFVVYSCKDKIPHSD